MVILGSREPERDAPALKRNSVPTSPAILRALIAFKAAVPGLFAFADAGYEPLQDATPAHRTAPPGLWPSLCYPPPHALGGTSRRRGEGLPVGVDRQKVEGRTTKMAVQVRRRCIFCSNATNAGMSDEHLWPRWSHPLFPVDETPAKGQLYWSTDVPNSGLLRGRHFWRREGHVNTITIRTVCEACNTGWMSRKETAVGPLLTGLIDRKQARLWRQDTELLASWFAMKAMVLEARGENGASPILTHEEGDAFRCTGQIPRKMSIWIGVADDPRYSANMKSVRLWAANEPQPTAKTTNVNVIWLAIRGVVGFVKINGSQFTLDKELPPPATFKRICPSGLTVRWPLEALKGAIDQFDEELPSHLSVTEQPSATSAKLKYEMKPMNIDVGSFRQSLKPKGSP